MSGASASASYSPRLWMPGIPNAAVTPFARRTPTMPWPPVRVETAVVIGLLVVAGALVSWRSATSGGRRTPVHRLPRQPHESYAAARRLVAPQRHQDVAVPEHRDRGLA